MSFASIKRQSLFRHFPVSLGYHHITWKFSFEMEVEVPVISGSPGSLLLLLAHLQSGVLLNLRNQRTKVYC